MNRPSHWIIATFAIMGPALWVWGFTEGFGTQQEAAPDAGGPRQERLEPQGQVVVATLEDKLDGRVIDHLGRPISGAQIRVLGGSGAAVTRSSGAFEVMVKLRDPYRRIEITANGFSSVVERCSPADLASFVVQMSSPAPWAVPANTPLSAKRVALAGEGFVLDADRRPLEACVVTCLETGDTALTDEVGRFLIPIGTSPASFVAWHANGHCAALEAVQPTQKEGMISLGVITSTAGAQLSGTVRLPDGTPIDSAAIVLRRQGLVRRSLTDQGGTFHLGGLVAADYDLEVLPAGGALGIKQPLRVEGPGSLKTELRLVAEAPLRVRVVDSKRVPRAKAYVLATDADARSAWAQVDGDGYATLRGLGTEGATVREARDADLAPLKILGTAIEAETTTVLTES